MHIGKAKIPTLKTKGQSLVVQSQQMQDRGVKIMDMNLVLDNMKAKIIGLSERDSRLDTAARQANGKCVWMMIAPVAMVTIDHRCPAKFTTPDNQGVIEQSAIL